MKLIEKVITTKEAATRWGLSQNKVQNACAGNKANPNVKILFNTDEARQSGSTWLVTLKGMERVFGVEKSKRVPFEVKAVERKTGFEDHIYTFVADLEEEAIKLAKKKREYGRHSVINLVFNGRKFNINGTEVKEIKGEM